MNHSNRTTFEEIMNHIKNLFKRFYSNLVLFFKNLFSKENTSKIKDKAHRFEQKTHDGVDTIKTSASRQEKKGRLKGFFRKGLFGFNIAYGVVRTTLFTLAITITLFGFLGLGTGM